MVGNRGEKRQPRSIHTAAVRESRARSGVTSNSLPRLALPPPRTVAQKQQRATDPTLSSRAMRKATRVLGVTAALLMLTASVPQDPGDLLTVTRKTTKLRSQKRSFAPAVADLAEGDKVAFQKKDGAWLAVKFGAIEGYVHESDVTTKSDVRLSGQGVRETYSTSETAAAKKGFNPQVEKQYRNDNPNLEKAFQLVDQVQARSVPEPELRKFLVDGRLLKEGQ